MKFYNTFEFGEEGYKKLFHFKSWRIAILNYIEELELDHIKYVEAHHKTDEAFVLLNGKCTLIFAHVNRKKVEDYTYVEMKQHIVYNIPKGIYHTHTLSKDAKVLIIEQENTSIKNSTRINLEQQDILKLKKLIEV